MALKKHITEINFNEFSNYRLTETSVDSDTVFRVSNPYSQYSESDGVIQNFIKINRKFSSYLATKKDNGLNFYSDLQQNLSNFSTEVNALGYFERYFWAGEIVNNSYFRGSAHTDIGRNSDGMLIIPTPTYNPWGKSNIRIKLKYNNLPANTFVPLCGYSFQDVYSEASSSNIYGSFNHGLQLWQTSTAYNAEGTDLVSGLGDGTKTNGLYAQVNQYAPVIPLAINSSTQTSNLYAGHTSPEWYHGLRRMGAPNRNAIAYFLYAHDGNGNAMIVMTNGDNAETDPTILPYSPTNLNYNILNAEGLPLFRQPHFFTSEFEAGRTLSDIWNTYQPQSSFTDGRSLMNHIVRNFYPRSSDYIGPYNTHEASTNYYLRDFGIKELDIKYPYSSYSSGSGPPYMLPRLIHSDCQILAFGSTSNADLQNVEEFVLQVDNMKTNQNVGVDYGGLTTRSDGAGNIGAQIFYSGKIGSLSFKNARGQHWMKNILTYQRHRYNTGYYLQTRVARSDALNYGDVIGGHLHLRPTYNEGGEIHNVIVADREANNNDNILVGSNTYSGTTLTFEPPTRNYLFPNFSSSTFSFDGLNSAKSSPNSIADPGSAWENESAILISDDQYAKLSKLGIDNAIYIPISNHLGGVSGGLSSHRVNLVSCSVNGIVRKTFDTVKLRMEIVDAQNIPLFKSGQNYGNSYDEKHIDISLAGSPLNEDIPPLNYKSDGIRFEFTLDDNLPITMDQLSGASLKIWIEEI
jgi:hypothetical protein